MFMWREFLLKGSYAGVKDTIEKGWVTSEKHFRGSIAKRRNL